MRGPGHIKVLPFRPQLHHVSEPPGVRTVPPRVPFKGGVPNYDFNAYRGGGGGSNNSPPTTGLHQRGNDTSSPGAPTTGLRKRGNDTSRSTGRSGRQNAATRRNMRREERVTVQGPAKNQQPDGMSTRDNFHVTIFGGRGLSRVKFRRQERWRNVGVTVPSVTAAAGIVSLEQGQGAITNECEAAQETVGSGAFVGVLGSSQKTQFRDQCCGDVLQLWSLCLGHVLLFCCSHLGVWHLEHWGFQGGQSGPRAKSPPPSVFCHHAAAEWAHYPEGAWPYPQGRALGRATNGPHGCASVRSMLRLLSDGCTPPPPPPAPCTVPPRAHDPPPPTRDVLERPYTVGRRGATPPSTPPPPPVPMFEADSHNFALAPSAPRRLKPQSFFPTFSGDHRGTLGGGGGQPNPPSPSDPPIRPLPPPF